ncbi:hypothetical protein [Paenibacillus polymyxa]|nr:hypothetical protein [Paenibacillus polymyxa]
MFGKKVFGVSGPSSSPAEGLASSEGIIISEEHNRFWRLLGDSLD